MTKMIDSFTGKYNFLSNFYKHENSTVEHYYQAMKTFNPFEQIKILHAPTPKEAKRLGRRCELREDWEDIKLLIMEVLIRLKFTNEHLKQLLLETEDAILIEGNHWGDTFWGQVNGVGNNWLGIILMKIRSELQKVEKEITSGDLF